MLTFTWLYGQKALDLRPVNQVCGELGPLQTNEDFGCEFILPGAVVLTTGQQARNAAELSGYVRTLQAKGAVGIGFGVEVHFDEVPAELIWTCEQVGMELFIVPKPVAFASIIQRVQAELVRRSRLDAEWLIDFQERCNGAANRGGLSALMDYVSSKLEMPLCIIDNDGRVQAGGDDEVVAVARQALAEGATQSRALAAGEKHGLSQRLRAKGERFFLLVGVRAAPFDSRLRTAFKHVAGLAEILLQQPVVVRETHTEINTLAMALLIGETHAGSNAVNTVFKQVIDSDGRVRPVVIEAPDPARLKRALQHIDEQSEARGRALFALPFGSDLALLFFRGSRKPREIKEQVEPEKFQLRCAIGGPTRIEDINADLTQKLVTEAMSAARGTVARSSLPIWLHNEEVVSSMQLRRSQTFDLLTQYDETNGTHLRETLEAFVRLDGHVQNIAATLGIHRHTVRARVHMISEICDINMNDPVVKAELLLTFLAAGPGLNQ
ncbi:MAG: helix-turn-helix domain-containing protein [Corynebacterium sp.]|nr:helix-turn-helix domain-containing protein [Corynebacterium sp.]